MLAHQRLCGVVEGAFAYRQGSVALVRLAQTLFTSVYCVCCLFPVLGPHVVCGSPVAVFCLCSLRVLFVFPSDKQSMSAALPLDFGPQPNMVTPGGMRFPTPLPARHVRSPRRLGVLTTSSRAAPAVGALGFLLACWTLLSSTTNATPSQATPLLAMRPCREPRAQVRSNHYVHAVAPGAEQPAREEYYRCTSLEPEQRHRDEPHAAYTAWGNGTLPPARLATALAVRPRTRDPAVAGGGTPSSIHGMRVKVLKNTGSSPK